MIRKTKQKHVKQSAIPGKSRPRSKGTKDKHVRKKSKVIKRIPAPSRQKIDLNTGWVYIIEHGLGKIQGKLEARQRAVEQRIEREREKMRELSQSQSTTVSTVSTVSSSSAASQSSQGSNTRNKDNSLAQPHLQQGEDGLDESGTMYLGSKKLVPHKVLSTEEFADLYTHVYRMCTQRQPKPDKIYSRLKDAIIDYNTNVILSAMKDCIKENGNLLQVLVDRWQMFSSYMNATNRVFCYLNKYYCKLNDKPPTSIMGINIFHETILSNPFIQEHIIKNINHKIMEIRRGWSVDAPEQKSYHQQPFSSPTTTSTPSPSTPESSPTEEKHERYVHFQEPASEPRSSISMSQHSAHPELGTPILPISAFSHHSKHPHHPSVSTTSLKRRKRKTQRVLELVQKAIQVFVGVDSMSLSVYRQLEELLIKPIDEYYERLGKQCENTTILQFFQKTDVWRTQERSIMRTLLHPSSYSNISKLFFDKVLRAHRIKIFQDKRSHWTEIFRDQNLQHISTIYRLYSESDSDLREIAEIFESNLAEQGMEIISSRFQRLNGFDEKETDHRKTPEREPQPPANLTSRPELDVEFVESFLRLYDKYHSFASIAFENHHLFETAMNKGFSRLLNADTGSITTTEIFAHFCDYILNKTYISRTDQQVEEYLDRLGGILSYTADEDMFLLIYRQHLAHRLLTGTSQSEEMERSMIAKLKLRIGPQGTSRLEGMLDDMKECFKFAKLYEDTHNKIDGSQNLVMNAKLLSGGWWPTIVEPHILPPREFESAIEQYTEFYIQENPRRILRYCNSLGSCEVCFETTSDTYRLLTTTYQGFVLVLFNDRHWRRKSVSSSCRASTTSKHSFITAATAGTAYTLPSTLGRESDASLGIGCLTDMEELTGQSGSGRRSYEGKLVLAPVSSRPSKESLSSNTTSTHQDEKHEFEFKEGISEREVKADHADLADEPLKDNTEPDQNTPRESNPKDTDLSQRHNKANVNKRSISGSRKRSSTFDSDIIGTSVSEQGPSERSSSTVPEHLPGQESISDATPSRAGQGQSDVRSSESEDLGSGLGNAFKDRRNSQMSQCSRSSFSQISQPPTGPVWLTLSDICERLDVHESFAKRILHSLSCGKFKVLKKLPESQSVLSSDRFCLNPDFECHHKNIKLPHPFLEPKLKVQFEKNRKIAIDSTIVKIMKKFKTLHHQKLVSRCVNKLRRFRLIEEQIEIRLPHLIDLDFLEIDVDDQGSVSSEVSRNSKSGNQKDTPQNKNVIYHYVP